MNKVMRLVAGIAPMLLLSACLLTPGKFTSSLDIRKDGSFTFAYVGEVIADDPSSGMEAAQDTADADDDSDMTPAEKSKKAADAVKAKANEQKQKDTKLREIAAALSKEKGYRSVKYLGGNKFSIDYQLSGKLDHSFLFPFNIDAQAALPFVAVEVRADGKVRVLAPGFGDGPDKGGAGPMGGLPGGGDDSKYRDGTFTLTTDAEIVSQNQEDGAKPVPTGKQIVWKVTPISRAAPMAVLKLTP